MHTSIKQNEIVLQYEIIAPGVYEALETLKRTGWVDHGVKNPESVKEHTIALIRLAQELFSELSEAEKQDLVEMLEVHDWAEAVCGDEVILELNPDDRKVLKDIKLENEKKALEKICEDLPNGEEIMQLWLRFETSSDPAAQFGRQLDKYQAVEKALAYEKAQGIPLFEEFLTYSIHFIQHPVLLERIERLKSEWRSHNTMDGQD